MERGFGRREGEGMSALEGGPVVEKGTGGGGEKESDGGAGISEEVEGELSSTGGRSGGRGCKARRWTGGEALRWRLGREIEGAMEEGEEGDMRWRGIGASFGPDLTKCGDDGVTQVEERGGGG